MYFSIRLVVHIYTLSYSKNQLDFLIARFLTYTERFQLQSHATFAHMNSSSNNSIDTSMSGSGRGRGRDGPLGNDIFRSRDARSTLTTFEAKNNASEVHSTSAAEKTREDDKEFERMIADITKTEDEFSRMMAEMEVEEAEREAYEKMFNEQQNRKKAEEAARAREADDAEVAAKMARCLRRRLYLMSETGK